MEGNRESLAPHRGGRSGVGIAEGRRLQRSTARATTGTAPPTRATRASSVAVAVVFVAVVARGGPPWGSPLWCLIRVLLRFFAATCGSGAVLSASRRAGCVGPGGPCGGASSRFGTWVKRGAVCIATGPSCAAGRVCAILAFRRNPARPAAASGGLVWAGWLVHV